MTKKEISKLLFNKEKNLTKLEKATISILENIISNIKEKNQLFVTVNSQMHDINSVLLDFYILNTYESRYIIKHSPRNNFFKQYDSINILKNLFKIELSDYFIVETEFRSILILHKSVNLKNISSYVKESTQNDNIVKIVNNDENGLLLDGKCTIFYKEYCELVKKIHGIELDTDKIKYNLLFDYLRTEKFKICFINQTKDILFLNDKNEYCIVGKRFCNNFLSIPEEILNADNVYLFKSYLKDMSLSNNELISIDIDTHNFKINIKIATEYIFKSFIKMINNYINNKDSWIEIFDDYYIYNRYTSDNNNKRQNVKIIYDALIQRCKNNLNFTAAYFDAELNN